MFIIQFRLLIIYHDEIKINHTTIGIVYKNSGNTYCKLVINYKQVNNCIIVWTNNNLIKCACTFFEVVIHAQDCPLTE